MMKFLFLLLSIHVVGGTQVRGVSRRRAQANKENNDQKVVAGGGTKNGVGVAMGKNTLSPTIFPTTLPSHQPTFLPTTAPSETPVPSPSPSAMPTISIPTTIPIITDAPTDSPTNAPPPTKSPTNTSTNAPTRTATDAPTNSALGAVQPVAPVSSTFPPTASPTRKPTFPPTIEPTHTGLLGYINLTLSVLAPNVTSMSYSVNTGHWPGVSPLLRDILVFLSFVFCEDTDFLVLGQGGIRLCGNGNIPMEFQPTIRFDKARVYVQDASVPAFNYTLWYLEFPVVELGTSFLRMALESGGGIEEGIELMENEAQLALNRQLRREVLDFNFTSDAQVSAVGLEMMTWLPDGFYEPLNPQPIHALRVAGLGLLAASLVGWFLLSSAALKRRRQMEWDEAAKARARGGLGTQDGLDYMLEASWKAQPQEQKNVPVSPTIVLAEEHNSDGEEVELCLPLPGAYTMNIPGRY